MRRLLKIILGLVVVGFVAIAAFGYIGDLSPSQMETRIPVTLSDK